MWKWFSVSAWAPYLKEGLFASDLMDRPRSAVVGAGNLVVRVCAGDLAVLRDLPA